MEKPPNPSLSPGPNLNPSAAKAPASATACNRRAASAWTLSCSLVTLLAFYVLSMVPVGRLYTAGYLASGTWHEEACKALYTPLLLAVKHLVGSAALLATGV